MNAPPLIGGKVGCGPGYDLTRDRDARCKIRDASGGRNVDNERFKMKDARSGVPDGTSERRDEGWETGENETQDRWNGRRNDRCEIKDEIWAM